MRCAVRRVDTGCVCHRFATTLGTPFQSMMLAFVISWLEVVMRFTVKWRDDRYRRCGARCFNGARQCGRSSRAKQRSASKYTEEHMIRRELIGFYHFLTVDTLAEVS